MNRKEEFFKALELGLSFGLSIVLPIVGGCLLGVWLDNQLGSRPRWTLSFLFLGFFMGLASLYQQTKKWGKK